MNAHASQILNVALKLKEKERAEIAAMLMQSLDEEVDPTAEAEWDAEIRKRLDEIDSGKVKMLSWQEIEEVLDE